LRPLASDSERSAEKSAKYIAVRLVLVLLVFIYVLLVLVGRIEGEARLGWAEFALIAFTILFAAGFFEKLAKLSIGEKGIEVTLDHIKAQQRAQGSDLEMLKIALSGLVTKYEFAHLAKLDAEGTYSVKYGDKFFEEITRLDDMGYIEPAKGNSSGFVVLRDKYAGRPGESFNLKDYMTITDQGRAYVRARDYR
jgi:hypothetical protein